MESDIKIRATVPEMNAFFMEDPGVRYMRLEDERFSPSALEAMPEETYLSTKFLFRVHYRHKELVRELRGIFTIPGLKERLKKANICYK